MTIRVGLVVNPIAGMGGSVGLKGTDGEMVERARELGATPVSPERTLTFLRHVTQHDAITWLVAAGSMGEAYAAAEGLDCVPVGPEEDERTTVEDTHRAARAAIDAGADLLVFVGGDGTARDVYDAVNADIPVLGVPAGVKVYSAVFALSPRAAAEMVDAVVDRLASRDVDTPTYGLSVTEAEVLDIDEDAFRADRLDAHLYGYLLVPDVQSLRQPGKEGSAITPDTEVSKREIAAAVIEQMDAETLYLLGPGTTVHAIADALGVSTTLLGIDAVVAGKLIASDLNERAMLNLLAEYPQRKIIVTPLGGNGFIFGRGNKPFTPQIIRAVGREHIVVVATERKMRALDTLRVDTGDSDVDEMLSGYIEVVIGYDLARVARVSAV